MRQIAFLLALSTAATLAIGCASPAEEQSEASENELVNAPRDTKNTWAVGICASEPNTDPAAGPLGACTTKGTRCTGSLIAPNLVLTARHCVEEVNYDNATSFCDGGFFEKPKAPKIRITLDPSVLGENIAWRDVAEVITEGAQNNSCKNDIAILRLSARVAKTDATPIALDTRPLARFHPQKVAVVGRGVLTDMFDLENGVPIDEANGGLLRRFMTDIPWGCVSNNPKRACVVDDYSSPPTNKFTLPTDAYFAIGAGTASGDSGSAVLSSAKFKNGKPTAYGVLSAGTYDKNGVGNYGLVTRLDIHEGWIKATLRANARDNFTLVSSQDIAASAD